MMKIINDNEWYSFFYNTISNTITIHIANTENNHEKRYLLQANSI